IINRSVNFHYNPLTIEIMLSCKSANDYILTRTSNTFKRTTKHLKNVLCTDKNVLTHSICLYGISHKNVLYTLNLVTQYWHKIDTFNLLNGISLLYNKV